jgi:hypothetical protein
MKSVSAYKNYSAVTISEFTESMSDLSGAEEFREASIP